MAATYFTFARSSGAKFLSEPMSSSSIARISSMLGRPPFGEEGAARLFDHHSRADTGRKM